MQNKLIKISPEIIPEETVIRHIHFIRGQKVMLDADLAELYQVKTKAFIQAVKRNMNHFPTDFMFQLNNKEYECLRSQFVTSNNGKGRGGRRYLPYAFTEQGVSMLSSILKSQHAVQTNDRRTHETKTSNGIYCKSKISIRQLTNHFITINYHHVWSQ